MALLITPNGEETKIEPENGKNFTLQELYKLIDCQLVQICEADKKDQILIFDEEFLFKHEPVLNHIATGRMASYMKPFTHSMICGNAVLCDSKQFN